MLIPFDNQAMWVCDFCLNAESDGAMRSRHTHAVICASCIKHLAGFTNTKVDPAASASGATQGVESEAWPIPISDASDTTLTPIGAMQSPTPRISRKGFMNPSSTYHPCHLCGELEHAHEMRVNIQNGAALCACCVKKHFEPWRDTSEAERHKYFSLKRQAEMERRFIPHLKRSKCQLKTQ